MEPRRLRHRHEIEQEFHDRKAAREEGDRSVYRQGALWRPFLRLLEAGGDLKDKRVLDLGCGEGWSTCHYAREGARVTAIDISYGALCKARERVTAEGLAERVRLVKGAAEDLPFRGIFDLAIGISVLHHTELAPTVAAVSRSLAPKGKGLFMEPLRHNPLLQLFRYVTPWRRSKTERPFSMNDLDGLGRHFRRVETVGYMLVGMAGLALAPFLRGETFYKLMGQLTKLDDRILEAAPPLKRYCWGVVIIAEK